MVEFNPKKIEKQIISLRLEENKLQQIDRISTQRNLSRNEFLVQCIDFALNHITDDKNKEYTCSET